MAKLLGAAGYQTAVVGKWHLGTDPTGFDYFHVLRGQGPYYNPNMLTSNGPVEHCLATIVSPLRVESSKTLPC